MNEYYGITTPTDDFLAHYGIKGMKWGVRKARFKGNDVALERHYNKAMKKLQKYKDKMDVSKQKEAAAYHRGKANRSAAVTAGLGSIGAAGLLGAHHIRKNKPQRYTEVFTFDPRSGKTVRKMQEVFDRDDNVNLLKGVGAAGLAGSAIAGAKTAYHVGKYAAALNRTTKSGHAKAVKKYAPKVAKWQKEVNETFAGTKYGKNKKRR